MVTKHQGDLPVLCGRFPLAIYFTFGSVYMSMTLSHFIPASPSPTPMPPSQCSYRTKFGTIRQKVLWDPSILSLGGYSAYMVKSKFIERNQYIPPPALFQGETLNPPTSNPATKTIITLLFELQFPFFPFFYCLLQLYWLHPDHTFLPPCVHSYCYLHLGFIFITFLKAHDTLSTMLDNLHTFSHYLPLWYILPIFIYL